MIEIKVKRRGLKSLFGGKLSSRSVVDIHLTGEHNIGPETDISSWFDWKPDKTSKTPSKSYPLHGLVATEYHHLTGETVVQASSLSRTTLRFKSADTLDILGLGHSLTELARSRDPNFEPQNIKGLKKAADVFIGHEKARDKGKPLIRK